MDLAERPIPPAALVGARPAAGDPDVALARGGRRASAARPRSTRGSSSEAYAVGRDGGRRARARPARRTGRASRTGSASSSRSTRPSRCPDDWKAKALGDARRRARARSSSWRAPPTSPASLRVAELQRRHRDGRVAIFPMGPDERARPRALGALRRRARLRPGRARDRAGPDCRSATCSTIYEVDRPRPIEALFGVVAGSTARSLSPRLHNALFRARDLPYLYLPLPGLGLRPREAARDRVRSAVPRLRRHAALEARGGARRPGPPRTCG